MVCSNLKGQLTDLHRRKFPTWRPRCTAVVSTTPSTPPGACFEECEAVKAYLAYVFMASDVMVARGVKFARAELIRLRTYCSSLQGRKIYKKYSKYSYY